MTRIACIVPARLESSRMPRKLLRDDDGTPLIVHTMRRVVDAEHAGLFTDAYIASDSDEILTLFDDWRQMHTGVHRSGTDRIAEAVASLEPENYDLIVNIQADEPEIQPEHIRALIDAALMVPGCDMATLAAPLKPDELMKPNVVKVQVQPDGFARCFTRMLVNEYPGMHHHLGVYAYTPRFLKWFTSLPQTPSEQREKLEQLRALDNGARIRVAVVPEAWPGIDTEEEYQAFVKRYKERQCQTT